MAGGAIGLPYSVATPILSNQMDYATVLEARGGAADATSRFSASPV